MPAGGAGGEDRAGQRAQLRSIHAVLQEQKLQQPAVRAKDRAALSQARYRSPALAIAAACLLSPILLGPRIREVFPKAEISVISGSPEWNAALAQHVDLFDAISLHQYGPVTCANGDDQVPDDEHWLSAIATFGRAQIDTNRTGGLPSELHGKSLWVTEFGLPQRGCERKFEELDAGTLRGAHWLSWLLGAISSYQNDVLAARVLTYHIFSNGWSSRIDRKTSLVSLRNPAANDDGYLVDNDGEITDTGPGFPNATEVLPNASQSHSPAAITPALASRTGQWHRTDLCARLRPGPARSEWADAKGGPVWLPDAAVLC